jgi:hypothetical protein
MPVDTHQCPHCGAYSHFTRLYSTNDITEPPGPEYYVFLSCDACSGPMIEQRRTKTGESADYLIKRIPQGILHRSYPDVPAVIAEVAEEAHRCLDAAAPRAAVTMARATVETVAKQNGINQGNLQTKIEKLYENEHISRAMRDAADEIRFAGNSAVHGDPKMEPTSIEEAESVVGFMDAILHRVYQEPAEVERIKERRRSKKGQSRTS